MRSHGVSDLTIKVQQLARKQDELQSQLDAVVAAQRKDAEMAAVLQSQVSKLSAIEQQIQQLASRFQSGRLGSDSRTVKSIASQQQFKDLKLHWTEKVPTLQQEIQTLQVQIDSLGNHAENFNANGLSIAAKESRNGKAQVRDFQKSHKTLERGDVAKDDSVRKPQVARGTLVEAASRLLDGGRGAAEECLKLIDESDVDDLNKRDSLGMTALHYFSLSGSVEAATALLGHVEFKEVNAVDLHRPNMKSQAYNRTALHIAALLGHVDIASAILGRADFTEVHAKDSDNFTALHLAVMKGHSDIVWLLKQYPPDNFVSQSLRQQRRDVSPVFSPYSPLHVRSFATQVAVNEQSQLVHSTRSHGHQSTEQADELRISPGRSGIMHRVDHYDSSGDAEWWAVGRMARSVRRPLED